MSKIKQRLNSRISALRNTGFFSVFMSNVISKVLTFFGGIIIVRVLSKNDYGLYTYIINCYSMLMLLGDLGCSMSTMQICNEHHEDRQKFDAVFLYGFRKAMVFSGVTALLIVLSPFFYPFQHAQARRLTQLLCFMPFISTANNFLLVNVRIRLENRKFAVLNTFSTAVHYILVLPLAYFFNVTGAVISNYVISIVTLVFGYFYTRPLLTFQKDGARLEQSEKKSFLKLAVASQLNSGINTGLMLLDVFLIGIFIVNTEVISSYKVATTIPSALAFIPASVMVYAVPYFARNNKNLAWVKDKYLKLLMAGTALNLMITLGGILCAGWIIPLVFGSQYEDSIKCFVILMIGYFFSASFQTPTANVIYTQHKVKINVIITIISGVLNCILDVVMILNYGSVGAAIATTTVHVIASVVSVLYMVYYLKGTGKENDA